MKKITIISFLFLILFLTGCKKSINKDLEIDTTMSFSQIKEVSYDGTRQIKNLHVTSEAYDLEDVYSFVYCKYSNLAVYKDSNNNYILKNFLTGQVICDKLYNIDFYNSSSISRISCIYTEDFLPVAVFIKEVTTISKKYLCVVDYKGEVLFNKEVNDINNYSHLNYNSFEYNHYTYFNLYDSYLDLNEYFKFKIEDGVLNLFKIESTIYQSDYEKKDNDEIIDIDGLIYGMSEGKYVAIRNKKDSVCAYTFKKDSNIFIYDENKKYLNTVNLSSFNMVDFDGVIILKGKLVIYMSEEIKNLQEQYGYNENCDDLYTYKSRCLEIDLKTGKTYYNDDLKYWIYKVEPAHNNCNIVTYYDLTEDGKKGNVLKSAIMDDAFRFDNSYVYDGLYMAQKINDNEYLGWFNQGINRLLFYITKKERIYLGSNISLQIFDDGNVIYSLNNKYHICKLENIKDDILQNNSGADRILQNKYDGEYIEVNGLLDGIGNYIGSIYLSRTCELYATSDKVYVGNKIIYELKDNEILYKIDCKEIGNHKYLISIDLGVKQLYFMCDINELD